MIRRAIASTGTLVSPVGLGTVKLGRVAGLKYAAAHTRLPTDEEAEGLLRAALELGVNVIDTAPAYGESERRLGKLLPRVAKREAWFISTKVGEVFDAGQGGTEGGSGASRYDFSAGHVARSIDESLAALRVSEVDLLLLHFPSSGLMDAETLQSGEVLSALMGVKRAGKARHVGVSVSSALGVRVVLESAERVDAVMVTLNASEQGMRGAIDEAAAAGVSVLIKKPLASGHVDAEASLRLVLNTRGVTSAIVGTASPAHLREAAEVAASVGPV